MSGAVTPVTEAIAALEAARTTPVAPGAPLVPGAVGILAVGDEVLTSYATGSAVLYDDSAALLPAHARVPMQLDTVFDVASLTKLFTATVAMQQVEAGLLELDAPVADHLPDFAAGGKAAITVRQLLTHTSGLEWWLPLWRDWPNRDARIHAALTHPPATPPGEQFVYSDLNLIALGVLLEQLGGATLDVLVHHGVTVPLGMRDTGFLTQLGHVETARFAATEIEDDTGRGLVRGEVHDENAWSLEGVAGHAGVFSTGADLLRFARVFTGSDPRILSADSVIVMTTNLNPDLPDDAHGIGFEIDQPRYMGELSGPRTIGHTGFTGTSLVADLASGATAILLTNAVHPHRPETSINALRAAWATGAARSLH
ncbi:MAG TPA: serine hydrolase domain-containing protein [Flexivirga sp.]|uniref:serine hydrolase domain-containing protein n=1 Tax=Flexivirga sp. TaxID=1962927 RepID=UPI002B5CA00B|nr:serine hydrolase domain-containing protein [Flexivirga sp.]HWC24869.1 serine hydrolase domain-containing protein [Flexivirga sp.]